jgi:hypothetical protein
VSDSTGSSLDGPDKGTKKLSPISQVSGIMPANPQIPGFYYGRSFHHLHSHIDPEKRKYFKIEEHAHRSHPYSKENITKRRRAEEQQARRSREFQIRTDNLSKIRPFQRWIHTATNVGGYVNAREFGLGTTRLDDREALQARLYRRKKVWQIRSTESDWEKLTCFAVREASGYTVFGTQGGLVCALPALHEETNVRLMGRQQAITHFTSKVTAIAVSQNPESSLFVCCSLGKDNYSGIIQIGRFDQNEDRLCEIISVIKPKQKQDLYCLAINRYMPEVFAVGGEYDVLVASEGGNGLRDLKSPGNCLALEFLGPHTLASGSRNGVVVCDAPFDELN